MEKAQSGTIAGDERPELSTALLWVEEKKAQGHHGPEPGPARPRAGGAGGGEQGQYAYGAPPYGWAARKKALTPAEAEQADRARARQLRDEHDLSFREIAAALDTEELPPKHGGRWHPETVRRMLANPTDRPPTLRKRQP